MGLQYSNTKIIRYHIVYWDTTLRYVDYPKAMFDYIEHPEAIYRYVKEPKISCTPVIIKLGSRHHSS